MTIKDELLNPYFIHVDNLNYTVKKERITNKGKKVEDNMSYHSTFAGCIKKILEYQINDNQAIVSLETYLRHITQAQEEFKLILEKLKI